jgi:hypothetical protein
MAATARRLLALLWLALAGLAWAEPMRMPGYLWEPPVSFGELQELGPDAFYAAFPADAEIEQSQLELIVVHTPRESVVTMQESGANPRTLALATFLGLTGRPEQINKTLFMGTTEARLVYLSENPRRHVVHIYQADLDDGSLVTVALRDYANGRPPLGDVLRAISDSFVSTSSSALPRN